MVGVGEEGLGFRDGGSVVGLGDSAVDEAGEAGVAEAAPDLALAVDGDTGEMAFGKAVLPGVDAEGAGTEPIEVAPAAAEPDEVTEMELAVPELLPER